MWGGLFVPVGQIVMSRVTTNWGYDMKTTDGMTDEEEGIH